MPTISKSRGQITSPFKAQLDSKLATYSALLKALRTGRTSIEDITRTGLSEDVLKRLAARRPPVDDSGEADFRFGGPSRFSVVEPEEQTNPRITVNTGGGQEPPPEDEGVQILEYDEVDGQRVFFEPVRVENPDDAEQYVMVEDTQSILFLGRADGIYRRFNFIQPKRGEN